MPRFFCQRRSAPDRLGSRGVRRARDLLADARYVVIGIKEPDRRVAALKFAASAPRTGFPRTGRRLDVASADLRSAVERPFNEVDRLADRCCQTSAPVHGAILGKTP
jgi:hypothetical protein